MTLIVRAARLGEATELAQIFHRAVQAAESYSMAQRNAWSPECPTVTQWAARLHGLTTLLAERAGKPIGFMALREDGYLDLAFVDPNFARQGVGRVLLDGLVIEARGLGLRRLWTEASLVARPFFEGRGWVVLCQQQVEKQGVEMTNFRMEIVIP